MRGVIYCRVSTREQATNLSLSTQLKACQDYCQRHDIEVAEMFEDAGESAKTTDRPEFQRLLSYCRTNKGRVQFVVVYNVTRFSRNAYDQGRPLTLQTFTALLKRPIYAGIIEAPGFGVAGIRGDFDPLVPEAVFQRVQAVLKGHTGPSRHHLDHPDFPLRRFVVCDRCSTPLTGSAPRGRTKTYPYYHCRKCRGVSIRRDTLHHRFLDLLETLRPRTEYLELFRAIVLDVWRVRTAEAGALRAALEVKLAELRRREELLEEAFLYAKKIDTMTYERQRDAIREQVALATIELEDARHEEADVEGVLSFAEHVLTNAARLWMEATPEQKTRLQRSLFPEGLRLRDGKIGTAVTCMAFTQLQGIEAGTSGLASPTGFEPVFWP